MPAFILNSIRHAHVSVGPSARECPPEPSSITSFLSSHFRKVHYNGLIPSVVHDRQRSRFCTDPGTDFRGVAPLSLGILTQRRREIVALGPQLYTLALLIKHSITCRTSIMSLLGRNSPLRVLNSERA